MKVNNRESNIRVSNMNIRIYNAEGETTLGNRVPNIYHLYASIYLCLPTYLLHLLLMPSFIYSVFYANFFLLFSPTVKYRKWNHSCSLQQYDTHNYELMKNSLHFVTKLTNIFIFIFWINIFPLCWRRKPSIRQVL